MAAPDRSVAKLADALAGRAGVEAVRWVLLGAPFRRVVREQLRRLLSDPDLLGACRLRRAKFRPGVRLSAWYDVGLCGRRASAPAPPPRQVMVTWTVAGGDGGRRAEGPTAAVAAAALDAGLGTPFGALEAELPGLGMRLLVWPLDPTHPQLVRASDPRHVPQMLRAGPAAAGRGPARYGVRAVRYRPGQRHVLRYDPLDLPDRKGDGRALFAKLYRPGVGARAFQVAEFIAAGLASSRGGVSAVRPIAYLPDDDVVLYPAVVGEPLTRRLGKPDAALGRHLGLAGAALRCLHAVASPTAELEMPSFNMERELCRVLGAGRRLGPIMPGADARVAAIVERAAALHERLPREGPGLAHGDYKADHLWIAPRGSGLTLIDFDSASLAEPALDLGKFLADLQWWYARRSPQMRLWAQQRFLDGYADAGGEQSQPLSAHDPPFERLCRARLYEALALTRIAAHRVRIFDRGCASHTEALLERAAAIVTDLEALA